MFISDKGMQCLAKESAPMHTAMINSPKNILIAWHVASKLSIRPAYLSTDTVENWVTMYRGTARKHIDEIGRSVYIDKAGIQEMVRQIVQYAARAWTEQRYMVFQTSTTDILTALQHYMPQLKVTTVDIERAQSLISDIGMNVAIDELFALAELGKTYPDIVGIMCTFRESNVMEDIPHVDRNHVITVATAVMDMFGLYMRCMQTLRYNPEVGVYPFTIMFTDIFNGADASTEVMEKYLSLVKHTYDPKKESAGLVPRMAGIVIR